MLTLSPRSIQTVKLFHMDTGASVKVVRLCTAVPGLTHLAYQPLPVILAPLGRLHYYPEYFCKTMSGHRLPVRLSPSRHSPVCLSGCGVTVFWLRCQFARNEMWGKKIRLPVQ